MGDFVNWAKTPEEGALVMRKGEGGLWSLDASLPVSADGQHLYKFIKNGQSTFDQDGWNPVSVDDGQTGRNSVLFFQYRYFTIGGGAMSETLRPPGYV